MSDEIDKALAEIYKKVIDESWSNPETFEAYQDSWKIVAEAFKVAKFDWTKGQRPRHGLARSMGHERHDYRKAKRTPG